MLSEVYIIGFDIIKRGSMALSSAGGAEFLCDNPLQIPKKYDILAQNIAGPAVDGSDLSCR